MNVCREEVKPFPRVIEEIYYSSLDMRLLLNILTETNGLWAPLLILSLFDPNFGQLFNVSHGSNEVALKFIKFAGSASKSLEHYS